MIACNAGIVLNLLPVELPGVVLDSFAFVGDSASPVALFALGLHLGGTGVRIRGTTAEEIRLIAFKCVAFPCSPSRCAATSSTSAATGSTTSC